MISVSALKFKGNDVPFFLKEGILPVACIRHFGVDNARKRVCVRAHRAPQTP